MAKDFRNPVFLGRVATLVIGIIVLGVGLHSHFKSEWTKTKANVVDTKENGLHVVCSSFKDVFKSLKIKCPSIGLERFYVSMIIIFYILSIALLAASIFIELETAPLKYVDLGIHILAAVLLLIGAILYFMSASQINGLTKSTKWPNSLKKFKLRYGEKITAGVFTLIQSAVYGVTSFFILRQ